VVLGNIVLDDTTVANGQGPGLVEDGASYASTTGDVVQWNDDTYYGLTTRTILTGGPMRIAYDTPSTDASFTMAAFDGFPDTILVEVYDSGGSLIFSTSVATPDSTPVPFSHSAADIGSIVLTGPTNGWSPNIDDHEYSAGFSFSITGPCPGQVTVATNGGTPNGNVAFVTGSSLGSFNVNAGPCAGIVLGLQGNVTLRAIRAADAAGAISFPATANAAICGRLYAQAVDLTTCATSNVVFIQ